MSTIDTLNHKRPVDPPNGGGAFAGAVPSATWRMLSNTGEQTKVPQGLDAHVDRVVGSARAFQKNANSMLQRAAVIVDMQQRISLLTDGQLKLEVSELRQIFRRGRQVENDVNRALAVVREIAHRQLGLRAHPEQVAAALTITAGLIAELATGEGKTLSASLAAVLAAWHGRGCHVITVNDYLAKRDATEMSPLYDFCGLSVAAIQQDMKPEQRRTAYAADITYCTNKETTADYLRDRLILGQIHSLSTVILGKLANVPCPPIDSLVQRGLPFAIVDEIDSILIDESVTPLIISGDAPNPEQVNIFTQAAEIATELEIEEDYKVEQQYHEVRMTPTGKRKLKEIGERLGGFWTGARRREELVVQALVAREIYLLGKQYVIQPNEKSQDKHDDIVIVDEFTGRLMADREWRDGLHQAVQAKEKLTVSMPKETLARISFQRFFRQYGRLSGMTATAWESRAEFWQIYRLGMVRLPTHKPCKRIQHDDCIYATTQQKWNAVVEQIRKVHATGQPILVGTRSVGASENLAKMLAAVGIETRILNAVRHAEEAQVVAHAGEAGKITVATNMAGRGTDIKLAPGVRELGGLFVIATERHESARVDRQLFGRSARQGDPGAAMAFVSLEDELLVRYTPAILRRAIMRYKSADGKIPNALGDRLVKLAQWKAGRTALASRQGVLKTDIYLSEMLGFVGRSA